MTDAEFRALHTVARIAEYFLTIEKQRSNGARLDVLENIQSELDKVMTIAFTERNERDQGLDWAEELA